MELLTGETLAERLRRGALPLDQALTFAGQIADALERAPSPGHRPSRLEARQRHAHQVRGQAPRLRPRPSCLPPGPAQVALSTGPTRVQGLTAEGTLVGTLQYMSPEQLEGKAVDARTDIFALGAVLYEMVTGSQAFGGGSPASIVSAILRDQPVPLAKRLPLRFRRARPPARPLPAKGS